jgi:hypothetical protein
VPHLIESVKNPFINLIAHSFHHSSEKPEITSYMLGMIDEFFANDWHKKYDINESFYFYMNAKEDVVYKGNIFYFLPQMHHGIFQDDDYGRQFYNRLFEAGLNPAELTHVYSVNEDAPEILTSKNIESSLKFIRHTHGLLDFLNINERRGLFFMNHIHQILPDNVFHQYMKEFSVLHKMVQYKLVGFIAQSQEFNVDVNMLDAQLNTPVFYIRDAEVLQAFDKLPVNWLYKNPDGKDVLSMFSTLDNEKKLYFTDYAQKKMQEQSLQPEMNIDPEYMKERIRDNLIEMVSHDALKPVLQNFLKHHKITYFSDIKDKNGNTPAMISLQNREWARYALFTDKDMMKQVNDSRKSLAHFAFETGQINAHTEKALSIITQIFSSQEHLNLGFNFGLSIMMQVFQRDKDKIVLPLTWLKKNPAYHTQLLGIDSHKNSQWKQVFDNFSSSQYQAYENKDKEILTKIFFDLTKDMMLAQDYHDELKQINLDKTVQFIFQKKIPFSQPDKMDYIISDFHFFAYKQFIQTLESLPECAPLVSQIEDIFKKKMLDYVLDGFYNPHATIGYSYNMGVEEFRATFCKKTDSLLHYLIEMDNDYIFQFPKEYLQHDGHTDYMKKMLRYFLLTDSVERSLGNEENNSSAKPLKI